MPAIPSSQVLLKSDKIPAGAQPENPVSMDELSDCLAIPEIVNPEHPGRLRPANKLLKDVKGYAPNDVGGQFGDDMGAKGGSGKTWKRKN